MFADWKVLYTKPRAEKQVAVDCRGMGLECYLPLRKAVRVYQRRKVTFLTPLFPGYIFVNLPFERRNELFFRGHVVREIKVLKPIRMLRQIAMVRKALRLDPGLEAVDPIREGEVVRVATGPLQGCEGVVSNIRRKSGKVVLTLSVDIIGKAVPIAVESNLVERLIDNRTKTYRRADDGGR